MPSIAPCRNDMTTVRLLESVIYNCLLRLVDTGVKFDVGLNDLDVHIQKYP